MKTKFLILNIILLIVITFSSRGFCQTNLNSSEQPKQYCFDSADVLKITKIATERDFLKKNIFEYIKSDSLDNLLISDMSSQLNDKEKIIINKDAIINKLLARPPILVNNAKWYYYAGSVSLGILLGVVIGFLAK